MKRRLRDQWLAIVSAAAVLVVVAMLAIILFDVVRHGASILSWTFITAPPSGGMQSGGVGPATGADCGIHRVMAGLVAK